MDMMMMMMNVYPGYAPDLRIRLYGNRAALIEGVVFAPRPIVELGVSPHSVARLRSPLVRAERDRDRQHQRYH